MTPSSARKTGEDGESFGRDVLDAIGEGLLVFDRDGRLAGCNQAAQRILGMRMQELEALGLDELSGRVIDEGERPAAFTPGAARREGVTIAGVVVGIRAGTGHVRWLRAAARPVEADGLPPYRVVVALADVTSELATEAERARIHRRWRTAFEEAPIGMALIAPGGQILDVNSQLCRLSGRDAEAIRATPWETFVHPDELPELADALQRLARGEEAVHQVELRLVRTDGSYLWCLVSAAVVFTPDGRIEHVIVHVQDISERRRHQDELAHMARHDPLTGLLNRRGFEQELLAHLERMRRYGGGGGVMLLDLDHFKRINDTLGHHAGDVVLVTAARALRGRLRRTDVLARLGGDEFAVLLPGAGVEEIEAVAGALLDAVRSEVELPARGCMNASAGAALISDGDVTPHDLMVSADLAMYDAKAAGRGRFVLAGAREPGARRASRRAWIDRIEHALDHDGLVLYAQPVRALGAPAVEQYELLLRMRNPEGGLVPPEAFLDAAERFGVIERIDRWVLERAVEILRATGDAGPVVEVNVSGRSIGEAMLDHISSRLEAAGVRPARLIVELSETAAARNLLHARRFAEGLASIGCRFALDDFGGGSGSLHYLKHVPCDFIKIDGEFVRFCAENNDDEVIVESLVGLAHGLGKAAIAEYVIDAATLGVVERHGVDFAQGFHVGMPQPAETLLATL